MDIPDSFQKKKDLGEKTKQLIDGPMLIRREKIGEGSELDEMLERFGYDAWCRPNSPMHSKIDSLLGKAGYKEITGKNPMYEYWSRPNQLATYEKDVFIRETKEGGIIHYNFATVHSGKLEEFCRRFEKTRSLENFPSGRDDKFMNMLAIAFYTSIGAGGIGGGVAATHYAGVAIKSIMFPFVAVFGAGVGAFAGLICFLAGMSALAYSSIKLCDMNMKKLENCCEEVIINNDKRAITAAFS